MNERQNTTSGDSAIRGPGRRRTPAPDATHAEAGFFARQIDLRAPLVFKLRDGESLCGVVVWQDRAALRVDVPEGGHLILQKLAVATVHRQADDLR